MQIIKCDECENLFKLPQDAIERLERVKKAGSGSIYLECPYCKERIYLIVLQQYIPSFII